jgi:photosystem II stability/assembly factor-like uncharacterized protein
VVSNRSIGSLLLLALAACGSDGEGDDEIYPYLGPPWANKYRTPTSSHLRAVRFVTALSGVIAGDATSFFRTNDGGLTWSQQEHQPLNRGGDVLALDVHPDDSLLHAAGREAALGRFWQSADSVNWQTADLPAAGSPFTSVDSVAAGTSYYLRESGVVEKHVGAATTPLDWDPTGTDTWQCLDMLGTTGTGYMAGSAGKIRKITNDGATAGDRVDQTLPGTVGTPVWRRVVALSLTAAFAVGDGGKMVFTLDGGTTWLEGTTGTAVNLTSIAMTSTLVGWAVGAGGTILRTGNSGVSWTPQGVGQTAETLNDVWFTDPLNGFAVGDFGVVLKTIDGGNTWANLTDPGGTVGKPQLNAVDSIGDGTRAIAVGNGGLILRTLNGGATWTALPSGTAQNLLGVSIPPMGTNQTAAYVCGASSTLLKTADFTATPVIWTAVPGVAPDDVPAGRTLRAIHFPTTEFFGYVVGDTGAAGEVYRTNDAAATWADQPVPASTAYHSVSSSLSGVVVYASGAGGKVARGGAAGTFWEDVSAGPFAAGTLPAGTVFSMQSPTAIDLYVSSSNGNVYRGVDLGTSPTLVTWVATTPPPVLPNATAFTSLANGFFTTGAGAAPDPGRIYLTSNGGTAWAQSFEHTPWALRGIWMSPAGIGYAVGDNGTILKTTSAGLQPPPP